MSMDYYFIGFNKGRNYIEDMKIRPKTDKDRDEFQRGFKEGQQRRKNDSFQYQKMVNQKTW
jgi:hypothetical protein